MSFILGKSKQIIACLLCLGVGVGIGYLLFKSSTAPPTQSATALRSENYELVSPILFGDYGNDQTSPQLASLAKSIQGYIAEQTSSGAVADVAVHIRQLKGDSAQVVIANDKRFNPASLMKLPLAMAFYRADSTTPGLLDKIGQVSFETDYNQGQAILPSQAPISGQEYSARDLIKMMLVNSDNIGYQLLLSEPQITEKLNLLLREIRIDINNAQVNSNSNKDVFTVKEMARFFRLLYNATYLDPDRSQEILKLLTQAEYHNGLRAGLPQGVKVATKYGYDIQATGNSPEIQLHECGIVYTPNPYLLCIMTKGAKDLPSQEAVLAQISKLVYEGLQP